MIRFFRLKNRETTNIRAECLTGRVPTHKYEVCMFRFCSSQFFFLYLFNLFPLFSQGEPNQYKQTGFHLGPA